MPTHARHARHAQSEKAYLLHEELPQALEVEAEHEALLAVGVRGGSGNGGASHAGDEVGAQQRPRVAAEVAGRLLGRALRSCATASGLARVGRPEGAVGLLAPHELDKGVVCPLDDRLQHLQGLLIVIFFVLKAFIHCGDWGRQEGEEGGGFAQDGGRVGKASRCEIRPPDDGFTAFVYRSQRQANRGCRAVLMPFHLAPFLQLERIYTEPLNNKTIIYNQL